MKRKNFIFSLKSNTALVIRKTKTWTIKSWRIDQEVDLYDRMNREWKAIQMRRNIPGQTELNDNKQAQFYMASYNLEGLRRFIFNSRFLDVFDLDNKTIEKIKTDEVELMKFGFKYIKYIMMIEQTLNIKDGGLEIRKKKPVEKTSP